ncbi:hypothetical protein R1flu_020864 [Riccia fluitans]|uniref:Uncharacterized protein n=1 Tax=Riccia fluitans TaxID=41844 RepID=A0ABD1ZPB6_9MARC
MAGRRKSVGPINYHELPRRKLQSLCKKYGFPANKTNVAMADALTALLNAPDRLGMRIDSPAVSSGRSSFYSSSCEVGDSPMVSPGVDSLPSISESRPELFRNLRITRLPEIMEDESPSEEVTVNPAEELSSRGDKEELFTSSVTTMITDISTSAAESVNLDGNLKDRDGGATEGEEALTSTPSEVGSGLEKEVKEMECRGDLKPGEGSSQDFLAVERSDIVETGSDELGVTAGSMLGDEATEADCDDRCTPHDGTSACDSLVGQNETGTKESDETVSPETESVENSGLITDSCVETLVSISEVTRESPVRQPDEMMTDVSDIKLKEAESAVELTEAGKTTASSSENEDNHSLDESQRVEEDVAAERIAAGGEATCFADNVMEATSNSELGCEAVGTGVDTPLPLSVMPHSAASDLSVSNRDGVRLVVELNKIGFPRLDMFETDGEIKISTHTSDGMKGKAASQGQAFQETDHFRSVWPQDESYGFKCLNPATLSPRVKRSLGIDIPKVPVPRLALLKLTRAASFTVNEIDIDSNPYNPPSFSADVSAAPLAPLKAAESAIAMEVEMVTTLEAETASLPDVEKSLETMEFTSASEENVERSDPCSPVPGHVKQILNLIESNSSEKEPAGTSRKDDYKQSHMVRSSRIAADIERASKLGKAKRAAILAGKRSLWPSTNPPDSQQESQPNNKEHDTSPCTGAGLPIANEGVRKFGEYDRGDPAEALVRPEKSEGESVCPRPTAEIIEADTLGSPQHNQRDAENDHSESSVSPLQLCDVSSVILKRYCSPVEITEETVVAGSSTRDGEAKVLPEEEKFGATGTPEGEEKLSAKEDVVDGDSTIRPSESASGAGLLTIKYVEIPRPMETNVECSPISELSWIRKATNLPTPKSQKLIEKVKRPASANLRKFEMLERAALNAAKKHRTPKKTSSAKVEVSDVVGKLTNSAASIEGQESAESLVDMEMGELNPAAVFLNSSKTPEKSTSPLGIRDCNRECGPLTLQPRSVSPKSPAIISLDAILQENCQESCKENVLGKESQRLRRHQDGYKTPLTGRSKQKALRAAELNAASQRVKLLKQRRGIEEEEETVSNTASPLKNSLIGRFL